MKKWEIELIKLLKADYDDRRGKNPRFSVRQYATRLGLSPGALSELLRGKRRLSEDKACHLLDKLDLMDRERRRLQALMGRPIKIQRLNVDPSKIDVILDWVDHAIIGLFELDNPKINAKWIAKKINIPLPEIEPRIQEFLSRGFLVQKESGQIVRLREDWSVQDAMNEQTQRAYAEEQLKLARHALAHGKKDRMFFSALTFTGTQAQIDGFQAEIRKVFDKLSALSEEQTKTDLIRFSVQAFPIDFSIIL